MNLNQRNSGKKQFEQLADRIKCEIREICVDCAHYLFKSMRSMNKSNKSHLVFRVLYYIYSQFHTKRMFFFPLLFDMKHSGWQKKTSLSHKQNYNICIGIVSIIFFRGFSKSQLLQAFEKSQIQRFQHLKYSKYEFIAVKFNEIHLF